MKINTKTYVEMLLDKEEYSDLLHVLKSISHNEIGTTEIEEIKSKASNLYWAMKGLKDVKKS